MSDAPRLSHGLLAALLAWPVLLAAGATYFLAERQDHAVAAALEASPRIAVVDEGAFVRAEAGGATPDDNFRAGLKRARDLATRLRASGYIVLERRYVLETPETLLVTP